MSKEEENDDNEFVRTEITGLRYPYNTDRNISLKKKMLEIDVLDKLSGKLTDRDEWEEDEDEDEDEEEDEEEQDE